MNAFLIDAVLLWKSSRPKIRKNWVLSPLTDEQLANILAMMLKGLTHEDVADYLREDHGIEIDLPRLSEFYSAVQPFFVPARNQASVRGSEEVVNQIAGKDQGQMDQANLFLLKRAAFEQLNLGVDPKMLAIFANAVLKIEEAKDRKEQRAFDREKFGVATCETFLKWLKDEQARSIAASNVSNQEKISELRRHFFADIDALEKSGQVQLPSSAKP